MEIKILIIRFSDAKEVLQSTPFLRQVRMTYPDAQIDFLTDKSAELLLKYNPHLDFLFTTESSRSFKEMSRIRKRLHLSSYTYIFDLQNNSLSKLLCLFLPGKKWGEKGKGLSGKKKEQKQFFPEMEKLFDKQKFLNQQPELFWKDTVAKPVVSFLKNRNIHSGYILVDTGKLSVREEYLNFIQDFLKKSNYKIVFLGAKRDFGLNMDENKRITFTDLRFNILEIAILINMSVSVLTSEDLYLSIAKALNIPAISFNSDISRILRNHKSFV